MSAATPIVDKQHLVYARFTATLAEQIRNLITPALIEEHRLKPLGQGSDALERVKNFFSRPPLFGLYARHAMREWQIIRLPVAGDRGPQPIDDTVYNTERDAYHAVFLKHVATLFGK